MRILWRSLGCSGFLKTYYRIITSNSQIPFTWISLAQSLHKTLAFYLYSQRNRFSTMPEIDKNKIDPELYSPPSQVRGMIKLDRTAFKKIVTIPVLNVRKEMVNKLVRSLKKALLQRPGIKRVIDDPKDEGNKLVMLDPYKIVSDDSFEESDRLLLKELNVSPQISSYSLELTYENFKTEEILRAVLPEGQDVTSGFSRIGHIAHLNLRDHQLPFKQLIGQVIIDKNQGITSVVNKINTIDNIYRNFQMEVLSGEENMITKVMSKFILRGRIYNYTSIKVRENNYIYEFDFSKVYWNPRLSTEHNRITELLRPGDVLFDVFAGVGPFAIPVAKKDCTVFANDLNPESHKWLLHNCKLNKVDQKVKIFNLDGKDFLQGPVREELMKLVKQTSKERKPHVHIVMNLPAMAIEFLGIFRCLLDGQTKNSELLPTVHCYSFSKADDPVKDVQQRAEALLGASLKGCSSVHLVRNVAPNKEMTCITFQVPASVLYENWPMNEEEQFLKSENLEGPPFKRLRTSKVSYEES